jgi:CheY-like chemotaxis protein
MNPAQQRAQILLVEDEELNRALVRAVLARSAVPVLSEAHLAEAGCLAEARSRLAEGPVDLILLDVQLPDGSGLELARELSETARDRRPKIVILTAGVLSTQQSAALASGCDAFVGKPFSQAELIGVMSAQLADRYPVTAG